jgi:4-amino-4-deoxy-L-arabinose transferase-like glycosyltransferase
LSWSSALLTDEGFYTHNARNVALFGHARTDEFNNELIMPALHFVQVGVFRLFGAGVLQARAISVLLGLLSLPILFSALRRAMGVRVAAIATLFLGLDHVSLLYSRMALMDTPASFVAICAFAAWVRGVEREGKGGCWLVAAGALFGGLLAVRGLALFVFPASLIALSGGRREGLRRGLWICAGLCIALGAYLVLWWLPHRVELARADGFYILAQLSPHGPGAIRANLTNALFGYSQGMAAYLLRHSPVLAGLSIWYLLAVRPAAGRSPAERFLTAWLVIGWALLALTRYPAPRYYVLFYPALAGTAAIALDRLAAGERRTLSATGAGLFGGFAAYHLLLLALHDRHGVAAVILYGAPFVVAVAVYERCAHRTEALRRAPAHMLAAAIAAFLLLDGLWLGHWLTHLECRRSTEDCLLGRWAPSGTVMIGDAAPALCMDNGFVAAPVIPGLANDMAPLEQFAGSRRCVVIVEGRRNTGWWQSRYPGVISPGNRRFLFRSVAGLMVGVYPVPADVHATTQGEEQVYATTQGGER